MVFNRNTFAALALTVAVAASWSSAFAATTCRDASGKFIKCASQTITPAVRCKDAKGKFASCSAPGAKPVASGAASAKPSKTVSAALAMTPKAPVHPANGAATTTP